MIQRIQSIYLLVAAVVSGALSFVFDLWEIAKDQFFAYEDYLFLGFFLSSALLSLVSIFLFKDRKKQLFLSKLNFIVNTILVGFIVYHLLKLSGGTQVPEKGIGVFLPLLSIVFIVLAHSAIKKDDDLVKSVDRLR